MTMVSINSKYILIIDIEEYLISECCGGVNVEKKAVPVNYEIINMLEEYGCNKEYALKCVQMNKHNSITSTYYLLVKNQKAQYIKACEKAGKNFNKYFDISNEKQELIDLLMSFESSSKKNKKKDSKFPKESVKESVKNAVKEASKEKYIKENKDQTKKVDNIEIVQERKVNETRPREHRSQERKPKIPLKEDFKMEHHTVDHTKGHSTMAQDKKEFDPEYMTVDYSKRENSRNSTTIRNIDTDDIINRKHLKQKEVEYIHPVMRDTTPGIIDDRAKPRAYAKSRRTGSTD